MVIDGAVSDVKVGYRMAVDRLGQDGIDLSLRSIWVEIDYVDSCLRVGRLQYIFGTRKKSARHCVVTFDNRSLQCSTVWGIGPGPEPFGERSIDMARVALGIHDALFTAAELSGKDLLRGLNTAAIEIELLLSPGEQRAMMGGHPLHSCVWAVSYEIFENSGRHGFLKVEIDASTGDLVDIIDQLEKVTGTYPKPDGDK